MHFTQEVLSSDGEQDATHDRIHRWLRETDPSTNHHMARDKREAGTGRWFFNTPHWQRWLTDKNSLLWLHGQAGCGKTVLSSTIVEEVRRFAKTQPNSATAYFYFDFRDSKKQQLRPCLASLASQLSWHRSVPSELKALHGDCNGAPASADDLQTVLVSITRTTGPAYIILDALDECPLDNNERSRDQVLDWLDAIKRESFTNLHVLCTSRNEPDIEQVLKTDLSATTLAIQGEEVKADIRRYIHAQLEKHKRLRTLDEQVKEEIQKSLTSRAGGMYVQLRGP
jgi:Cdc6-like AAA superfamily ATPase